MAPRLLHSGEILLFEYVMLQNAIISLLIIVVVPCCAIILLRTLVKKKRQRRPVHSFRLN
jgi:hypothetical protein